MADRVNLLGIFASSGILDFQMEVGKQEEKFRLFNIALEVGLRF